ncbi:MAG: GTP-binding protein [Pseudomonadales bacterium]|nr:GTP-binding protein [Pseudomonadales bacterium]
MIPFTVIGGYLGAGKTTLLNELLRNANGRKLALLINDFGEINIDALLIESREDNRINLSNGCICCTLSDGFHAAIESLTEAAPDQIIVEASGVADVHTLAQYGHSPQLQLDGVIVLADAETVRIKSKDKFVGRTIQRQLAAADIIVANKMDLLDKATQAEVISWLETHYPAAVICPAINGQVPLHLVMGVHLVDKAATTDSGHAHFTRWSWQQPAGVGVEDLQQFLAHLPPEVLRLKGTLSQPDGTRVIQVVGQRQEIRSAPEITAEGLTLVAIGVEGQLECAQLDQAAGRFFKPDP